MKKLLLLLFLYAIPVKSQPITPAFTTGTSSSTTNTTTSISEFITSTDYFGNGYEYTVTGVGVSMSESISPPITTINGTVNGEAQTWTGLDLNNKPNWTVVDGNAFQFTETYRAPGSISNITTIQRNIESESVVTTTSVFSQ
jgi:hypothetical protein